MDITVNIAFIIIFVTWIIAFAVTIAKENRKKARRRAYIQKRYAKSIRKAA